MCIVLFIERQLQRGTAHQGHAAEPCWEIHVHGRDHRGQRQRLGPAGRQG